MTAAISFIKSLSLEWNIALLIAGGIAVWLAGTKLAQYADAIATRTGTGHAFVGALFLGGATSLPETATTFTASYSGSAPIATNNLFGGVAFQVVVLAILDFMIRGKALSFAVKDKIVSIQAALSALLIAFILTGIVASNMAATGDTLNFRYKSINISLWSPCIFLFAIGFFYLVKKIQHIRAEEKKESGHDSDQRDQEKESGGENDEEEEYHKLSNKKLALYTILAAITILAAGVVVASNGEAIANKTNLAEGLVGAVFIAITTSLPELSTGVSAIRLKKYELLCSDIFGSNIFDLSLFFLADLLYTKGPILSNVDENAQLTALLAIMLTLIYTVGFLLRRNRSFLRAGIDSWFVLLLYLAGITVLFLLQQ